MFFFFNDTATTEIYTLSLHDALPIYVGAGAAHADLDAPHFVHLARAVLDRVLDERLEDEVRHERRSEEHTSELQSRQYLVCRLLLEKKNNISSRHSTNENRYTVPLQH